MAIKIISQNWETIYQTYQQYFPIFKDHFRYFPSEIEHLTTYSPQCEFKDQSFVLLENDTPLFVCPLFTGQSIAGYFDLPTEWLWSPSALSSRDKKKYNLIIEHLKDIKENRKYLFYMDDHDITYCFPEIKDITTSIETLVDLNLSEEAIRSHIRKSFRSLINWGKNNLELTLIDRENPSQKTFKEAIAFYHQTIGSEKSEKCWNALYQEIQNDEAFIVVCHYQGNLVSSSVFKYGNERSSYAYGVYDKELEKENVPVTHWPLYFSILELKKRGVKTFSHGEFAFNATDDKIWNIWLFKRGLSTHSITKPVTTI